MNENRKIDMGDLFEGLQNQMLAQLNTNREFINHPTTKGDSLENVWIEWLRKYLPNRYRVDKAIVVDSSGSLSEQIDLVIYDQQYTPFVFTQNGVHYIPAEGVYAIFEVKPDLQGTAESGGKSLSYIEYAGKKIASVRSLKRTSTNIVDRGQSRPPRPLTTIIGGILTSTNSFAKKETIENHLKNLGALETLDLCCSIEYSSFHLSYKDGKESNSDTDLNKKLVSYYENRTLDTIKFSPKEKALVSFFLQLLQSLQNIGTVAAIDLAAYASAIKYELDK